jgi:uncharacterized protein YdaU (DUF1376 family)
MAEYHSYMWSVPDWRTDEMYTMLDNREQGVYRNLMDECFVAGSITSDMEALARFSREPIDYFATVWAKIRRKFQPIQNGERLISPRMERDRRRLVLKGKFYEKRAKKAAEARWLKANAEADARTRFSIQNDQKTPTSNPNHSSVVHATSIAQALLGDAQTQTHKEENLSFLHSPNNSTSTSFQHRGTARNNRRY